MMSLVQPIAILVTTLLVLEPTFASPVTQLVQTGASVGVLMSDYTREVQSLHTTVGILRHTLLKKLSTARSSDLTASCFTYPYHPSKPDTSRLKDDIETLRKLLPVTTSAAHFEAGLNVSNTSIGVLLVNETVTKLEYILSEFTEVGEALHPVDSAATEEGGVQGKTVGSSASDESCALVRSVLQEYEVILQLYIALTYTVNDAVKLNNYYNSPA